MNTIEPTNDTPARLSRPIGLRLFDNRQRKIAAQVSKTSARRREAVQHEELISVNSSLSRSARV
jgi:hypothetical protein